MFSPLSALSLHQLCPLLDLIHLPLCESQIAAFVVRRFVLISCFISLMLITVLVHFIRAFHIITFFVNSLTICHRLNFHPKLKTTASFFSGRLIL